MCSKNDLWLFIEKIIASDSFWKANYYFRSMKKQPHGGVAHILSPNMYLKHFAANTYILFCKKPLEIPYFLSKLIEETYQQFIKSEIDIEELCWLCFNDDNFWYVGFRILKPKKEFEEKNKRTPIIWSVIQKKLRFQDYFELDKKALVYVLVCYLIKNKMIEIKGVKEIRSYEILRIPHNKYGLSLVNEAKFLRQGFIIDGRYYLYNIFFDTSIGAATDEIPITLKIINEICENKNFYFRCDEILSVPQENKMSTASMDFQKFRGLEIDFGRIESIIYKKEIIVHYDPDTLNKVVLMIKSDKDENNEIFYHIEIEELWNPEKIKDNIVTTNYIHAKYYSKIKTFNHVDFSVNEYEKNIYEKKYMDAVHETKIPIDKKANEHYKIWCVESPEVSIETWNKLVYVTLDEPFRNLFIEITKMEV